MRALWLREALGCALVALPPAWGVLSAAFGG